MAGDTGWLKPALSRISVPTGDPGTDWLRRENIVSEVNFGASSWMYMSPWSPPDVPETSSLVWDWVYPSGIAPSNAVVTGLEIKLWSYFYEHSGRPEDVDCNPIKLQLGPATLINEPPGNPATRFRVIPYGNPPPWPISDDPLDAESLMTIGGPGNVFDLGADYPISLFLTRVASNTAAGAFHSLFRVGMDRIEPVEIPLQSYETAIYLSHIQMKVYWDVPVTAVDLGGDPEIVVSKTSDLQVIHNLEALLVTDVIIEQAQLGGISAMKSDPEVTVGLPADLTKGLGFIDSTAHPTVVFTIDNVDLALLRFSDMFSSPEVTLDVGVVNPGTRIDIASSPSIFISVGHNLVSVVIADVEPVIVVSLDADLSADTDMVSDPTLYVSVTANLQGDINLASWCGEALLETVVSLIADLGYSRSLYSAPNTYVTLDGNGLVVGVALEFSPLVSVTIPWANLQSKFAEPAPDHRTVFKCPVDRTIRITRKDKTIL